MIPQIKQISAFYLNYIFQPCRLPVLFRIQNRYCRTADLAAVSINSPSRSLLWQENKCMSIFRFASCIGSTSNYCEYLKNESTKNALKNDVQTVQAVSFLGMQLDKDEVTTALYSQFVIALCLLVFALNYVVLLLCGNPGPKQITVHEKILLWKRSSCFKLLEYRRNCS